MEPGRDDVDSTESPSNNDTQSVNQVMDTVQNLMDGISTQDNVDMVQSVIDQARNGEDISQSIPQLTQHLIPQLGNHGETLNELLGIQPGNKNYWASCLQQMLQDPETMERMNSVFAQLVPMLAENENGEEDEEQKNDDNNNDEEEEENETNTGMAGIAELFMQLQQSNNNNNSNSPGVNNEDTQRMAQLLNGVGENQLNEPVDCGQIFSHLLQGTQSQTDSIPVPAPPTNNNTQTVPTNLSLEQIIGEMFNNQDDLSSPDPTPDPQSK